MKFETISIHAGERPDESTGAVSVPIYQTATYAWKDVDTKRKGYWYSRMGNPTRKVLEDTVAKLEGGKAGFAFATGTAAATTIMHLLKAGDHVICTDDVYGGTYHLFQDIMTDFGLEFTFIRMDSPQKIEEAIRPNTRMLWVETPSNPLLNIVDIDMAFGIAKKHGILTVIDNTFATPYFLKPIEYGADIVFHSTTKYLNGHNDVSGGVVVTTTDELTERLDYLTSGLGTPAAPFDCWLVLRGIATLGIRMERHQENAFAVANFLHEHPAVRKVFYPGLPTHPGHETAKRQMKGFGGMVSFEINGGAGEVNDFLKRIRIFTLAVSLGSVVSLTEHPASMSHKEMPEEHRLKAGITNELVRLSVGLENSDDLTEDLAQALARP